MRDVADLEREQGVLLARWRLVAAQHPERGVAPSVDPAGGGLDAPLLVLMEQPARATAAGGHLPRPGGRREGLRSTTHAGGSTSC